jgi:invasion protein IalB
MKHLNWLVKSMAAASIAGCGIAAAQTPPAAAPPSQQQPQQPPPVAAWRVDCAGDGKTLECQTLQQLINREDGKLVVMVSVRLPPKAAPVMMLQLPLGLNVAEPVEIKVDNGIAEKQPIQTCTTAGCFAGMPLDDKFVIAMRTGSVLKVTVQDTNKRPITLEVPLLGFGVALDKAK